MSASTAARRRGRVDAEHERPSIDFGRVLGRVCVCLCRGLGRRLAR